jgi:signal transduction histidine kinase
VELGLAFNSMAEALAAQKRSLEEGKAALESAYFEAAEKNRAYLEMLGFVTHELKSPLAAIVFGIGSLREGLLGPLAPAQEAALRSAAYSADYLQATIANYLNLSRLEEGKLRLELQDVPLQRAVLGPLVERFVELATERGMRLESDVGEDLVARCDKGLVAAVFGNLVSNAIKYGGTAGRIRISAERVDAATLACHVWNDGPGFDPADAERLFRKFSRLREGRSDTRSGTGLGLYVSRQIVERHGGRIWAESDPGHWARFSFTVPAAEVAPPGPVSG